MTSIALHLKAPDALTLQLSWCDETHVLRQTTVEVRLGDADGRRTLVLRDVARRQVVYAVDGQGRPGEAPDVAALKRQVAVALWEEVTRALNAALTPGA